MLDFKGAIFDLDGTLIDSMGVWETIDIKFLQDRNISMPEDYINEVNTMSFKDVARYTIERFELNDTEESLIKQWNEMAIQEYSYNIKLKSNAREYLEKLKSNNIKIGLATASPKELYEPVLKNNRVYKYFDAFVSLEDVKRDKSYPDIYLLTAKRLGINPQDCVAFEDILVAIRTLKKTKFKVIGVYDEYASHDVEKIKGICDKFIYDFKELL